jgi:DnaK suppressor protein
MRDFSRIESRLYAQRDALVKRVNSIEKTIRHNDEVLDDDFAEQAVQRQNDEVLDALDDSGIAELRLINLALQRLNEGSFGVCIACGTEIPYERLEAIPYAERCIDCAELDD